MTQIPFDLSYSALCHGLYEKAAELAKANDAYAASFPDTVSQGLFSSLPTARKEIAQRYYLHAAALCRWLEGTETDVSAVGSLMQQADLATDSKTVLRLDAFFDQYKRFRQAVNDYLTQSEAHLSGENDTVSLPDLHKALRTLHAHTAIWQQFLAQEQSEKTS